MARHIYFICPISNLPSGGTKKIYDQVEILNKKGVSAFVLHTMFGKRYQWSNCTAPVAYVDLTSFEIISSTPEKQKHPLTNEEDLLVIPEIYVDEMLLYMDYPALKKTSFVIFNQNAYNTFVAAPNVKTAYGLGEVAYPPLYKSDRLLGTITVSEDNFNYLRFAFPNLETYRLYICANSSIFYPQQKKKQQMVFLTRKCKTHSTQIVKILETRNKIPNWSFVALDLVKEDVVAQTMRDSAIFLSFSNQEGCPLPPMEAMLCGCIIIGYHGEGGKEYIKDPYAFPINHGDILAFAKTIEQVALTYEQNPSYYSEQTKAATTFIQTHYTREIEERSTWEIWSKILEKHQRRLYSDGGNG